MLQPADRGLGGAILLGSIRESIDRILDEQAFGRASMVKNDLDFYNRVAGEWWDESSQIHTLNKMNPHRFGYFDRFISDWTGLAVLDVGCGGGYSCELLAKRGARAFGIDLSEACIQAARDHARQSGLDIDYQVGVGEALPYSPEMFDAVICVDVLEHVADAKQVVAEVFRVLKPGGQFFFDTINKTLQSKLVMIWFMENLLGAIPKGVHDWELFIDPRELTDWMQAAGYADIEIRGFDLFGDVLRLNPWSFFRFKQTGELPVKINDDTSIMYIGKAGKPDR